MCTNPNARVLSLAEVKKKLGDGNAVLIDVREPSELKSRGTVPTAVNIPVGYINEAFGMDDEDFKIIIGAEKPQSDDPVIFFCVKGIRAKNAQDLVQNKFKYTQSYFYPGSFEHLL